MPTAYWVHLKGVFACRCHTVVDVTHPHPLEQFEFIHVTRATIDMEEPHVVATVDFNLGVENPITDKEKYRVFHNNRLKVTAYCS